MKTVYYAFVKSLEVVDDITVKELDDLIFKRTFEENGEKPADYIWSEKPNLF